MPPQQWSFNRDAQGRMPVFHFDAAVSGAAQGHGRAWPAWLGRGGTGPVNAGAHAFPGNVNRNEERERDRKHKQKVRTSKPQPKRSAAFSPERPCPVPSGAPQVMEGIMTELRREVDRLDEDAWMFKKLPF
ncbi:unnamed protein product [Effrenium voratum]|uniref:Uncharacterized protein n=1 Tax=Effrenium voratum TaxID=2562239 RepID=A0AA36IV65_9DINO|nr:unnamed protein product [Effrenium voratum]